MDIKSSPVATAGTLLLHGALLLALWQTATSRITAAPAMPQATQVELLSLDTPPAPAATALAPAPTTPQKPAASRAQAATTPSRPENRPRSHAASDTAASPAPAESSSSHTSAPATSSATTAPGSQRGTTDGSAHEAPPSFTADYLANPAPAYPPLSQELGESGQVRLRVTVDASGAPSQVEIAESSGFTRLDRAALSAVKRWRFVPARRGSEAVAGRVIVPIHFNLKTLEG
ncbi:energy transducer TonB [Laribacter hongkongensis]|uniref:energy transducer TonB n=1 Tax=Laribacter hongkongensis TaxID=168471 RepID=UPI001EFD1264|nr:energy transducer TonB [Laribacter hongkongensis]MCG9081399.1 energy transducer TonB [Laribacter hongkongensis]